MPTKQMYLDGTTGVACIVNYDNAEDARLDPLANIDDVFFHSEIPYVRIKEEFTASTTFSAVSLSYGTATWLYTIVYVKVEPIIETIYVGNTSIAEPLLFMEVGGVPVAGAYTLQFSSGNYVRTIVPIVDSSGDIYIVSYGTAIATTLPSITSSIKIYVAD